MAIKKYKPTSPGIRHRLGHGFEEITKSTPLKSLTKPIKRSGGRNNYGHLTVKCLGGGHKRKYREIDFVRSKDTIFGRVESIEYDPNRTSRIAQLVYQDGHKSYILAPQGLGVNGRVLSGEKIPIDVGNTLKLSDIPPGTFVHNIELRKGVGGKLVRSAGTQAQVLAKEGLSVHVKLPSGEVRLIHQDCRATIGQVGNSEHRGICGGKAGHSRWRGRRPRTRPRAMNPVDHPLGGGEGKTSGGRHPCSLWGQISKGLKTRDKRKDNSHVIQRRIPKRLKKKGLA